MKVQRSTQLAMDNSPTTHMQPLQVPPSPSHSNPVEDFEEEAAAIQPEQEACSWDEEEQLELKYAEVHCPTPDIFELDSFAAHLTWGEPYFGAKGEDGEEPQELQIHRFEVDWTRVDDPDQPFTEDSWRPLPSGDVDTPDVKVAGLRPGHTYAVRVRPVVDWDDVEQDTWDIHTLPSNPAVFTTLPSAPSQCKPPVLVSRDRKSLKVKWPHPDEPGGPAMHISYSLFVSPPPTDHTGMADPEGFVQVYSGEEPSFKLQKLNPGQRYTFWVMAWNQVGCSERGIPATYTTQATVPAQPTPPVAVKSNETSVSLHWRAPNNNGSEITGYTLERDEGVPFGQQTPTQPQPGGHTFSLVYAGPLLCAQVKGLRCGHRYRFRLRANNDEGSSYWSECLVASTAASLPSCPTTPTVVSTSRTSATVSWSLPENNGGAEVGYHQAELQALSHAAIDVMGAEWLQTYENTTNGCTFMSLRPGCSYRARMRCANTSGWGSYCFPIEFATAPDVPDAPGPPAIQEGGTHALLIQWHPPLHDGGARITRYHLELMPMPGSAFTPSPVVLHLTQQQQLAAANGITQGVNAQLSCKGPQVRLPDPRIPPPPVRTSSSGPPMPHIHPLAQRAASRQATHSPSSPSLPPHPSPHSLLYPFTSLHPDHPLHPLHCPKHPASPAVSPAAMMQHPTAAALLSQHPMAAQEAMEPATYLVYTGEEPLAHVAGLHPGAAYQFRVQAINSQGPGQWSEWGVLHTAAGVPPPPGPPIAASRPTSTALAIKWQPPLGNSGALVTGYLVQMLVLGFVPSEGGEARLTVRRPAASLAQELRTSHGQRSRNGSGSHPLSAADVASQGGLASSHGGASSVSTFSDEASGENMLCPELSGDAQAGHADDLAFVPQWTPVCKCNTTSTELRGLEPSTRYAIRVAAINRVGQGSWSADGLLQTAPAPPTPPTGVQAEAVGPHAIGVSWSPCTLDNGAPLIGYAVDLLHLGAVGSSSFVRLAHTAGATGPWEHVATVSPHDSNTLIAGLRPGRFYRVRVRALNACGSSVPSSAPSLVTTHAAPPGPPGKVVVMQRGAAHARLKWEPCAVENGAAVKQYCLEINGPLADDFTPSGDVPKPLDKQMANGLGSSCAGSADDSLDDLTSAAALLSSADSSSAWRVAYIGSATQTRVNGLLPSTHYWCRVAGLNRIGPGSCSQAETFTTALLPPGPPQGTEACVEHAADMLAGSWSGLGGSQAPTTANLQHANSKVVVVRWEPPMPNPLEAAPVGYEVQALPLLAAQAATAAQHGSGEVCCSAPKRALECVIERGLLPGVSYMVRVRAVGAGGSGHGAWSAAAEVVGPGCLFGNSESASMSDLNDGTSSTLHQPHVDAKSGSKSRKGGKGGGQQQNPSSSPAGKAGGAVHKVVAQTSATALAKPAPPPMTLRGLKFQCGRLCRRAKAYAHYVLVLFGVAALAHGVQNYPLTLWDSWKRYRDVIMLLGILLLVFCVIGVVIWARSSKQAPPKKVSKSKERKKARGQ